MRSNMSLGKYRSNESLMKPEKRLLKYYRHIQRLVKQKASRYDFDYDDVLQFVLHHLSENDYKKIRSFEEGGDANFKTFITIVVVRLIFSFGRQTKIRKNRLEKFGRSLLTQEILAPDKSLIEMEENQFRKKAQELLPAVLKTLTDDEQRIIKMKYYEGLKISTLSRAFKISRFKMVRRLEEAMEKLRLKLKEAINKNKGPGD